MVDRVVNVVLGDTVLARRVVNLHPIIVLRKAARSVARRADSTHRSPNSETSQCRRAPVTLRADECERRPPLGGPVALDGGRARACSDVRLHPKRQAHAASQRDSLRIGSGGCSGRVGGANQPNHCAARAFVKAKVARPAIGLGFADRVS